MLLLRFLSKTKFYMQERCKRVKYLSTEGCDISFVWKGFIPFGDQEDNVLSLLLIQSPLLSEGETSQN